jgi:hypothetical protein
VAATIAAVEGDALARLIGQLGDTEADSLASVLATLAQRLSSTLGENLAGVYLTGSFALGSGDKHSDVDFLVATHDPLNGHEEQAVRDLHRVLPDQQEHWAHNLEGSYASLRDLRQRANPKTVWLYVDNGSRDMQWSAHDNTEVFRWMLRNRAISICGPAGATLLDTVPPLVLRQEAVALAVTRMRDIAHDRDYLRNGWGQPHEVLTRCRLLYTASHAEVIGKTEAATWAKKVLPEEWHDLIDQAIADRPNPWQRVHQQADPSLAQRTWQFIEFITPLIAHAATQDA